MPVDEYHGLITDEHLHHSVIHFEGGHASVRVNPDIKDIIVRYEIQYQFEEDKDHIRIESRDAENEQGVRHITFIVSPLYRSQKNEAQSLSYAFIMPYLGG